MRQTAKDGLKLRKVFRDLNSHVASVEVNGDDIEVMIRPDQDEMGLMIPFNEDGEKVAVTVTPSVVKRWHREAQEARSFMRRVISGEGDTRYQELAGYGRTRPGNSRR